MARSVTKTFAGRKRCNETEDISLTDDNREYMDTLDALGPCPYIITHSQPMRIWIMIYNSSVNEQLEVGANTLFHIWVKYKSRLPAWYYQEKLLKVGDSLVQFKEYRLALYQCYGRYLEQFCSTDIDNVTDVKQFQTTFFPNGTDDKRAGLTFHALQGRCICMYQLVKTSDPNLQNEESVKKCLSILSFLQLVMQVVLPQEHLCWLIFNGTLHIYTICRHLMVRGHSAKALEFLLWASVCMESSVPLLSVHYLTWRATLYTAVCQCYFDCQAGVHGEVFARRALVKINDLNQLENMSDSSYSEECKNAFKEATTKMAVMIFKRAVFESRRKPKGILRPKQKSNLKDIEKFPWPRTNTEKLLVEMFAGGAAAQFLAILEALSQSNRRVLQGGPPVPDEPEIHDVIAELFFAGTDILSGGGNKADRSSHGNCQTELCKLLKQMSLLELAVKGDDAVSAEAVVKFAKLAFSYEHWDAFDSIIAPIYTFLQAQDSSKCKKEELDLKILIAAEPLLSAKRHKHGIYIHEKDLRLEEISSSLGIVGLKRSHGESVGDRLLDEHINLAETLFSCVCNSMQDVQADRDIVSDVILFLWQKCKTGVQRITAATADGGKFILKCEQSMKWIYILCLLYEVMQYCNIIDTDPVIMGEASLKLSSIAEGIAESILKYGTKSERTFEKLNDDMSVHTESFSKVIYLKKNPVTQLVFAYETLEKAINGMSLARSRVIMSDESSMIDQHRTTLGVKRPLPRDTSDVQDIPSKSFANTAVMIDLQLELIVTQHRVSVKLLNLLQGGSEQLKSSKSSAHSAASLPFRTESEIIDKINKNQISKAIFLMQKSVLFKSGLGGVSPKKLLEDSEKLIQKYEAEENTMHLSCMKPETLKNGKKNVPPPPILVSRTANSMVFKPVPFPTDVKVSWYCLYGRCVAGPNLKVRLNDHHLSGTGEEIPADSSTLLEVTGLQANEKYIFAIAAYSSDGVLVGDTIGESTKPILAFPLLSVSAAWGYLAQSAYQVGNYQVAKKACSVLWNYFVLPSPCTQTEVTAINKDSIAQKRLCLDAVSNSSPILLQLFLRSIFIFSDIDIKEGALFCDAVCDYGVLRKCQMRRIAECERLLVAVDVSAWQSDASYALQAVVQCYGLIAPVIYHRIPSVPVVQILIKCLAVLQEIPSSTWQKKPTGVSEGVLHMIACIVYYVAKVLHQWEEYEMAIAVIEIAKRLLDVTENASSSLHIPVSGAGNDETENVKEATDKDKLSKIFFLKGPKKSQKKKILIGEKVNEQLAALKQNLLKLTKPPDGKELTAQEDPILLYLMVTCWPPNTAYREVMKIKKKARFLEFFVQLLQRELYEERFQRILEWSNTVFDILKRRNENALGKKIREETDDVTASSDSFKRYTAALVEYHKNPEEVAGEQAKKRDGTEKHKAGLKGHQKKQKGQQRSLGEEDLKKRAFATLTMLLTPVVGRYIKRKRLMKTSMEEMPWRSQMNLLLAFTHFSLFQKVLSQLFHEKLPQTQSLNSYKILDPEIFSLHHAGTVVMATETNAGDEQMLSPGHLHPSLKLDLPSGDKLTESNNVSEPSTKRSEVDTPRTQMTNETETSRSTKEQGKHNMSLFILLDHLGKTFLHLKRAVVLAHRGGHWTLLQNTCRSLWNLTLEVQLMIKQAEVSKESFPITKDLLNSEAWEPFYLASDMLLSMLVALQKSGSIKVIDNEESFGVTSCMGGIADEEGGSNLTFEYPFDDVNVVDLRWICQVVLKTIEILYQMERWEALVHIAIQFNVLTHERYTEQVTPLLVHAQRILISRICDTNEATEATDDHEGKICCRNYTGEYSGASVGKKGQTGNPGGRELKVRVCVPIDVMDTLACFRESLQKSKYPSRALRHSRKLLTLFLAHGQGLNPQEGLTNRYSQYGRVGFSRGVAQRHRSAPPNLSEEEFHSIYSIESKAISPSHLSTVISSYDKTIEILHSAKQQGLKAQALHELGSLHLFTGNKRAAFKCWCQALDEMLNMPDALNSWQELDSSPDSKRNGRSKDYSEKFLCRAGIWGCLLAAVITAKMSRYILTSNLKKRTECCMLSASLYKAMFRVSLPHPKEDRDYALYEIGDGCEVSELIPGIDLFSDQYRADVNTVVACLSFIMFELHSAGHNLVVLPLFTLYQYFVSMVCRDPVTSIEGRILKIKVLTDLHLFTEAFHEISIISHGKRIPRRPHKGFKPSGKPKICPKFTSSDTVLSRENLQAIEDILNRKPSATLLSVCDQAAMDKFMLAKMHFILRLSSTLNAIPETVNKSTYEEKEVSKNLRSKATEDDSVAHTHPKTDEADIPVQLTEQVHTIPRLKRILLNEVEKKTNAILLDLQTKNHGQLLQCSAGELEMATEARLQLSVVAQQRHQTALSVAMAYSAMQLLQNAKIFAHRSQHSFGNVLPPVQGTEKDLPCETEARERLSMRMWLRCRLALVNALVLQMRGMAKQDKDILDGATIVTEGIMEAETLGDFETQAHLMLQAAILDIQEGQPKTGVQYLLQNIIHLLKGEHLISPAASLILAQSFILTADLMEMKKEEDPQVFWTNQLSTYTLAHELIIKQFVSLGEAVQHHISDPTLTSPLQPFRNIYMPYMNLLAKVKLRIGHVIALKACNAPNTPLDPSHLLPSLTLQTTALELCRNSSFREYDLEAELLFQKGNIERQMFMLGDHEKCMAVQTFSDAIRVSCNYDQNLGLIRKSYLEIALLYFHRANLDRNELSGKDLPTVETVKQSKTKRKGEKATKMDDSGKPVSPGQFYTLLTWIAIRAATQAGDAMLASKKLIGQNIVTAHNLKRELQDNIPSFVCMDLLAAYKNFVPGENSWKQESSAEHSTEGDVSSIHCLSKETLSWVHLIHYHNHLMRLISMSNLRGSVQPVDGKGYSAGTLYSSVYSNGLTQRFAEMHNFLKKYLSAYASCCVDEFPQELLKGIEKPPNGFSLLLETLHESRGSQQITPPSEKEVASVFTDLKQEPSCEPMAVTSVGKELCMQWYFPALEKAPQGESMVLLLYAYNKQNISIKDLRRFDPANLLCGHCWIPLSQVVSLNEELSALKQQAEVSLLPEIESRVEKQKKSPSTGKSKVDLKVTSVPEELQVMTKKCCSNVQSVLSAVQNLQPLTKAPFDITLPSLIRLEKIFHLTYGCMLMRESLLDWIVSLLT
ncbi:cilia- and flagella-associated protein 54 [Spea bombifrons]|uniref:cilia- and flagella-associated protein 54 n=1 Tax=Spea bombifrons TaxID=233779 RepID=UPI00234B4110|nr:cilia- and flagella-associated protein 54 [Spea bombifrons]